MKKIIVFGSVASFDLFEQVNQCNFIMTKRFINSSFASQFSSKPCAFNEKSLDGLSVSQKDSLKADLQKEAYYKLNNLPSDLIVIDFINERLPLIKFADGTLATLSAELRKANLMKAQKCVVIEPKSKEYFEIWAACWDSFVRRMKAADLLHKIRINRVFWARNKTDSTAEFGKLYNEQEIYEMNVYLHQLYTYCSKDLKTEQFFTYLDTQIVANMKHRWGATPFHYDQVFYEAMYKNLLMN